MRGTRNDVFLPHELGYGLREENLNSDAHIGGEIALHYLGNAGELNYRIGGNFSFARSKHLSTYNPTFSSSWEDRKSTRLNSSHVAISYAVFCLKKKNTSETL